MSEIGYFSLRRFSGRLFWAFVGLATVMLGTGIGAALLLNIADASNQEQLLRQRQVSDTRALQEIFLQQRAGLELITHFNVTNALDFVVSTSTKETKLIEQIGNDFKGNDEASQNFNRILGIYRANALRFATSLITKQNPEQERQVYETAKNDFDEMIRQTNLLQQDRESAADQAGLTARQVMDNTRWAYVLVSLGLFGVALAFALMIARTVAQPVGVLIKRLSRVAEGDLTGQMQPKGLSEMVELSLIFNRTMANLKLALARIQDQTGAITQASRRIHASSDNQAVSLGQQAVGVAQVSTTIAELSDTSQHIANSAMLVANSATSALNSATDGYDMMLGANETMHEIRAKVNLIADRILALNSVAQRIREITTLIDTLSNETHLLALNAAIESAGAGEEGERFAVVASHVRKLAQRSRVAAVEIQQLVSQIQYATASSVMATEEGVKVVVLGEKMLSESLQAHENIINQIGQTSQLAQAISQATEQQRVASTQAALTMQELRELSLGATGQNEQYLLSVTDLTEVVNQLNLVVNTFVVQEPEPLLSDEPAYLPTPADPPLDLRQTDPLLA